MLIYSALLSVLLIACVVADAIAQTITTAEPPQQKVYEIFLKVLFPTLWTAVAPFVTKGITWILLKGMAAVPQSLQVVISSVAGALMAGLAGAIPDFPLTIESAATMGAAGGASGQLLANMNPTAVQPKKD